MTKIIIFRPLYKLIKRPDTIGTLRDPDWIQTNDPKLRRFVLYSAELPDHF